MPAQHVVPSGTLHDSNAAPTQSCKSSASAPDEQYVVQADRCQHMAFCGDVYDHKIIRSCWQKHAEKGCIAVLTGSRDIL